MTWQGVITISLGAILIENFVLVRFLGVCPFLGMSKKPGAALGMSFSVIFIMTASAASAWAVKHMALVPLKLEYLSTIAFILIIAVLVQLLEVLLRRYTPALFASLGIYLPLIAANCAVLGVALIVADTGGSFIESVLFAFMSGVGFSLALMLFSSVRARLEFSEHPEAFEGFPIALITAGLIALAFTGFSGISIF
jgi:electron transport complex protein RnfA